MASFSLLTFSLLILLSPPSLSHSTSTSTSFSKTPSTQGPISSSSSLSHSTFTSFSKTPSTQRPNPSSSSSPLSPKASLIRYWNRKIPNNKPQPLFFTSKLSPLSPLDLTTYTSLSSSQLSSKLSSFCSQANLLCSPSTLTPSLSSHSSPSDFSSYIDSSNFTNYATKGLALTNSFKNYSESQTTFGRYSHDAISDEDRFSGYSGGNVVTTNFTSYSGGATGGSGQFSGYDASTNVPTLKFTNYDAKATGVVRDFKGYTENANAVNENFASYGKHGVFGNNSFTSYSDGSNAINAGFSGYNEHNSISSDQFNSYGENGNVPEIEFKSYGDGVVFGHDVFKTYRNQSNVGDDSFTSYGKKAAGEEATFANYGESFNEGSDTFKGYGEGTTTDKFNFTSYSGEITGFKEYEKGNQFTFKSYVNASTVPHSDGTKVEETNMEKKKMTKKKAANSLNKWVVEPGKFFRESNLKKGTVMPMPDIRDKMPPRSFLPRSIASKIPFSASEVREIFKMPEDTAMGKAIGDTITECERAPSRGETKRCGTSAEDIIDFAVSVLGPDVVVRSTENTKGSSGNIMIGDVKGVNGGKITQSVSCHQSLFPYMVYYCHSVPKVRVYEADILNIDSREKINHGVAICHIDTSDWSAGHGAFMALGSGPGKIEVCHWIFEGDMTWAKAD